MIERVREIANRHRKAAGLVLAGLALAGCGSSVSANRAALTNCGDKTYNEAAGQIGTSASSALATARRDVILLHKRAELAGGSINLSRYSSVTEITASPAELDLNFERGNTHGYSTLFGLAIFGHQHYKDVVHFPIENAKTQIIAGAILCFTKNGLETNGTDQALEQYVHETAALGN